jgi:hypothetical protein
MYEMEGPQLGALSRVCRLLSGHSPASPALPGVSPSGIARLPALCHPRIAPGDWDRLGRE